MYDLDSLVIGAGVIGLAAARQLSLAEHEVVIVEQNAHIGSETSARNSEVIHAGIYYPKGSLKAHTCVEGKAQLYRFCEEHGVPFNRIGKFIVAENDVQATMLDGIEEHALANGVDDLQMLDREAMQAIEPQLAGKAALFSPSTGIIDSHAYMLALLGEAQENGCVLALNTKATSWRIRAKGGFEVTFDDDDTTKLRVRHLIVSTGLNAADFVGKNEGTFSAPIPTLHYAKGNYFRLAGRAPFKHLIYPVPESGGLGVHLTLDMNSQARFGPDVEWVNAIDYTVDGNRVNAFYSAIRAYWPDLPDNALQPDYSGIRPKLSAPGESNADFQIWDAKAHGINGLVILLGMESPGLTASLATADLVYQAVQH
jgi:L-2-hydroxyglutarate oxidase LhgO